MHGVAQKLILSTLVAVCAASSAHADDIQIFGAALGAAAGGLVGSQFGHGNSQYAAAGLGIATGGLIGHAAGHAVEMADASSSGNSNPHYGIFSDPAPGTYDSYHPNYVAPPAPSPIYADPHAGTYCRPYSQRARIAGRIQENYGTACLQSDGSWRVMQ